MNFDSIFPKNYIEREVEKKIFKFLPDREIIAIRGPRQSGKTTLLAKLGILLSQKYGKEKIVFVNFEDELEKIKFEQKPKEYLSFYLRGGKRVFFLLDEVQYVKNAGKILKLLFDLYPQAKLIVSGSSTLDISHLGSYLVGRAIFFELPPFSFAEFLKAKDTKLFLEYQERKFLLDSPKLADSLQKDKLNPLLSEYLTFGGYPRVVLEKDKEKKKIILANIFSTYIEKDIVKLYGIKYKEKAITLLKYLSEILGNLLNFNDLCQVASLYFKEVKELLSIFEETYVIKKIPPFHKNLVTELKKNPKIYFYDLGLCNVLGDNFILSSDKLGRLAENYVFLAHKDKPLSFWRTTAKAEVDFVIKDKLIPIEVKIAPKITRSLLSFLETYQPNYALLANWEIAKTVKRKNYKIFFIPLSLL